MLNSREVFILVEPVSFSCRLVCLSPSVLTRITSPKLSALSSSDQTPDRCNSAIRNRISRRGHHKYWLATRMTMTTFDKPSLTTASVQLYMFELPTHDVPNTLSSIPIIHTCIINCGLFHVLVPCTNCC